MFPKWTALFEWYNGITMYTPFQTYPNGTFNYKSDPTVVQGDSSLGDVMEVKAIVARFFDSGHVQIWKLDPYIGEHLI